MGYDTTNPLANIFGTAPLILVLIGIMLIVAVIMRFVCFRSSTMKEFLQNIKEKVFWNTFLRYWLEEYLTISIASLIKL